MEIPCSEKCALSLYLFLTHFSRMNFPISIGRTNLFLILVVLGGIIYSYSNSNRKFREKTVVALIRRRDLGLCCLPMSHKKRTLGLYGLTTKEI